MVCKFDKGVRVKGAGFPNDFAAFDRPDLTEEGEDQILGDGMVQVAHVQGPAKIKKL
jgi:hypothetical protein